MVEDQEDIQVTNSIQENMKWQLELGKNVNYALTGFYGNKPSILEQTEELYNIVSSNAHLRKKEWVPKITGEYRHKNPEPDEEFLQRYRNRFNAEQEIRRCNGEEC